MSRYRKQGISYFRLDAKLAHKLDKRIARAGYSSRSEFFTAVAYVALYDIKSIKEKQKPEIQENVSKLPENVVDWVHAAMPRMSEEEILTELHAVIAGMLFPVVAMKGIDIAFENTWEDVRRAFYEKSGVWVTESDLREAYASFEVVWRTDLAQYRERQLRGDEE